jgi:Sulfatase
MVPREPTTLPAVRPNVLLLVFDTARAGTFEPYGAEPGATPAFADLARRGAVAQDARANASWTVPSHAAMLTGLLPRATGTSQISGDDAHPAFRAALQAHRHRNLAEVLRRTGFSTRAVSTNFWLTPSSGFDIGFDDFVNVDTRRQARLAEGGIRKRAGWLWEGARAQVDDGAAEAGAILRRWLAEPPQAPFLWFVNLVECHSPYLPPRPYDDLGLSDRLLAAEEARRHLTLDAIWRACAGGPAPPPEALARMRYLYARAIRLLDDWLASLLEALDRARLLDETLVIVTSDHGENLGEQGLMGHCFSLDERLIRVPLAAAGPGADGLASTRSLAELPRRIAAAIGLDAHPWGAGVPPGPVAVAQFDSPIEPGHPRLEPTLERWGVGAETAWRITTALEAATDGRWKLLRRGVAEELYDLDADALEASPLDPGDGPAAVVEHLRAALVDPAATAAPPEAEVTPGDEISASERAKLEERMALLGYM